MDAFFASIEERDKPRLKGSPIVIGANPEDGRGRGVVSTANYKAREYGIHSAMPIREAWMLSEKAKKEGKPPAVFIIPHGRRYGEVSLKIMTLINKLVPQIERVSIDEAYLDLSFTGSFESAKKLAEKIKHEIEAKENLTCSIGVAPNKLIAKIASDMQKPNGLTIISENGVETFLDPLSIRKIPGIGPKTEALLNRRNIKKISDLKKLKKEELENLLGKWGKDLYRKARGEDSSPVAESDEIKSIGEQETFPEDILDPNIITKKLKQLTQSIYETFRKSGFKKYKTVTITVRFQGFETKNRSHTFAAPADDQTTLEFEAVKLLFPFFDKRENPKKKKIRLIGVRIEKLSS